MKSKDLPRCICGAGVCICGMDMDEAVEHYGYDKGRTRFGWAAHCMDCDVAIGKPGYYDPCANSQDQAERRWIKLIDELKAKKDAE